MPDRIIREQCRTSPNLDQVADFSERLFWRLTVSVDDYGRFDANPKVIASVCFPLRENLSRRIEAAMRDLAAHALVHLYAVNGRWYGWLLGWPKHQRHRDSKPKFPAPPVSTINDQSSTIAANCGEVPQVAAYSVSRESRGGRRTHASSAAGAAGGFDQFWAIYPRKVAKPRARKAWAKLAPSEHLTATILAAVSAATTSEDWRKDDGHWIPHPASWLNDRRWEDEPRDPEGLSPALRALSDKVLGHGR